MKKLALISLSVLTLTACSDRDEYKQTIFDLVSSDDDIRTYHLDPQTVADCIFDLSSKNMPGVLPFEPRRQETYAGYTKMISLKTSKNPAQVLADLRESFGSAEALSDAHMNYSASYLECISTVTNMELDDEEDATEDAATAE